MDQHQAAQRLLKHLQRTMNPHDAEDLAQEVWLRITAAPNQRRKSLLYLLRTAHRIRIDRSRRRSPNLEDLEGTEPEPATTEPDPRTVASDRERYERILSRVKPRDRPIITMKLQGYTQQEIASKLRLTRQTIDHRMRRAVNSLSRLHDVKSKAGG